MRKVIITISLIILIPVLTDAQEINRKGFYFSIGIGPGLTNYKLDGSIAKPENATLYYGSNWLGDINSDDIVGDLEKYPFSKTSFGLRTNFNLGYGINNQLIISYMNRVSYILDDILHQTNYISHYINPPALTIAGITGLEVDYYLSEEVKSPYLSVGGGFSLLNQPGVQDYLTQTGFGLSFGGGYQLTKHLSLDLSILYLKGDLTNKIKNEIESQGNNISIDGTYRAISFGLDIKYVLF
jgi:opacity protein-like surface antigen